MRTVLVTGANGFVGRSLIEELLTRGWAVKGLVRQVNGLTGEPWQQVKLIAGNLDDEQALRTALEGVDAVVHLAARVHQVRENANNALELYRLTNVEGTRKLINASLCQGVQHFVYLSSIKAMGEQTSKQKPYTETDQCNPVDAYGISKLESEQVVLDASQKGLKTIILRAPLVYGPGVKANFYRMMQAVQKGIPLPLGCVENVRSMIYVRNLVDAIVTSLNCEDVSGRVFLVSDVESVSTKTLLTMLGQAMGKKTRLFKIPLSILHATGALVGLGPQMQRLTESLVVDTCSIRSLMHWTPPYSLQTGIENTVAWFKSTHSR